MLTLEKLKAMSPETIIATGIVKNNQDGVYMTDTNLNQDMRWVAVRGGYHDWAIYIHWAFNDVDFVRKSGDKVTSKDNIQKLVPCDEEVYKMYRY